MIRRYQRKDRMSSDNWKLEASNDTPQALYERLIKQQKKSDSRFRYYTYISIGFSVICLILLFYTITRPTTVPVLISVNESTGESRYLGAATKYSYTGMNIPEIAVENQLRRFIKNVFYVPSDYAVLKDNLTDCYASCTKAAAQKLSDQIKNDDVIQNRTYLRTVEIESYIKVSNNSYQIDFFVKTLTTAGKQYKQQKYRAVITTKMMEPSDSDKLLNPLGIYITDYDYTIINEVK